MKVEFLRPYALILIPLAAIYIFLTLRRLKLEGFKKRAIASLRIALLLFLIIAMSLPNIRWFTRNTSTIYIIDASDSMRDYIKNAEDFVISGIEEREESDLQGVVVFGESPRVEAFVAKSPVFKKIETKVLTGATDIEEALNLGMSLLPEDTRRRIVLLTDGEENEGRAQRTAQNIRDKGIDFKVYRVEKQQKQDIEVESINIPQRVSLGQDFNITVNINSNINASAVLTLYSGREGVMERTIQVTKGKNRFIFKDTAGSGGFKTYRAQLSSRADMESRNNEAAAFVDIKDKPRVLVVEGAPGEGNEIQRILKASAIDYRVTAPQYAPTTVEELAAYKTVITCNVSAENLRDSTLKALEIYVRDFGGGYIATGGDNSFALGGYFKTPLETILPVDMELKGKKEIPKMSMMLIIDKSGSMSQGAGGISKVELAKEAAARVVDSMRDKDEANVIAFDNNINWVVRNKTLDKRDEIKKDIGTIVSGGGTNILPALQEGFKGIKDSDAKIKHIILLTDGQAEKTGYDKLMEDMKKAGITVSTVALGSDADQNLLEWIAKAGNGRYYFSKDYHNLPRIFAKETFLATGEYLKNRDFTPAVEPHAIVRDFSGFPNLLGYVVSTKKDRASSILTSDEGDPILTVWQYGLGKTAAWNSDISGRWSRNYTGWEGNLKLWQNIINWTIENYDDKGAFLEVREEEGRAFATLTDKFGENAEVTLSVVTPDLQNREVKMQPIGVDKYGASLPADSQGVYLVRATETEGGNILKVMSSGYVKGYSKEYKMGASSSLDALVQEAGGRFISKPLEIYKGGLKPVQGGINLVPLLLILSLMLFLAEILTRKLNPPLEKWMERLGRAFRPKANAREKKARIKPEVPVKAVKEERARQAEEVKEGKPRKKEKPGQQEELDVSALIKKKNSRYE